MSGWSVPPKITGLVSPGKVLAGGLGVLPAVLLLVADIPGWVKVWIWLPVVAVPATVVFGRVGNRPLYEVVQSALLFLMRQRRMVWQRTACVPEMQRVLVRPEQVSWRAIISHHLRKVFAYCIAVTVLIVIMPLITMLARCAFLASPRSGMAASVSSPLAAPTPYVLTPSPEPTVPPTATPAMVYTWGVHYVDGGYLGIGNPAPAVCDVSLAAGAGKWRATVRVVGMAQIKGLMVPLLLEPGVLTVESTCNLQVELVPYRPMSPYRSAVWFVPVCDPPGHVMVKSHNVGARLGVLEENGQPGEMVALNVERSVTAPIPGDGKGCWTYWIEGEAPFFPEVIVMTR